MAFRFRFEQLLKLAQFEEDAVKNRMTRVDAQISGIDGELMKIRQLYETALEDKTEDLLAGRMNKLHMYMGYFTRLDKAKVYYEDDRERIMNQREKIAAELAEKRRIRKTYEKLRERQEKQYQKNERKKEQKLMDEFSNLSRGSVFAGGGDD